MNILYRNFLKIEHPNIFTNLFDLFHPMGRKKDTSAFLLQLEDFIFD